MKKARLDPLLLAAVIGFAVLLVFFTVRNLPQKPVQVSAFELQPQAPEASGTESAAPAQININTATLDQLMSLPGIGEVYASRILAYREENGPFRSVGELAKVEGIGEKRLEALWDLVTTGG